MKQLWDVYCDGDIYWGRFMAETAEEAIKLSIDASNEDDLLLEALEVFTAIPVYQQYWRVGQ